MIYWFVMCLIAAIDLCIMLNMETDPLPDHNIVEKFFCSVVGNGAAIFIIIVLLVFSYGLTIISYRFVVHYLPPSVRSFLLGSLILVVIHYFSTWAWGKHHSKSKSICLSAVNEKQNEEKHLAMGSKD